MGTIYLLHFDRPYQHAAHYTGWTTDLEVRLAQHRAGDGARLMAVIRQAGIGFELVRTWRGDRTLERRLKKRHNARRLCPTCRRRPGDGERLPLPLES
jgi:predicted GIY-YIG superfamily endonuclease